MVKKYIKSVDEEGEKDEPQLMKLYKKHIIEFKMDWKNL